MMANSVMELLVSFVFLEVGGWLLKEGSFAVFSFPRWASSWVFTSYAVATRLGGGVPIFQKEGAVFAAGVGNDVPVFQEGGPAVWSAGLYFSTSSPHGCPVILSADGVKKVRGAIPEVYAMYPLNLYLLSCGMSSYGNLQIMSGGFPGIWLCTCVVVMVRILEFNVVLVHNWKVKLLTVYAILQPWVFLGSSSNMLLGMRLAGNL
nr:hypothetical protein [Tanacetum cinerariifolium]